MGRALLACLYVPTRPVPPLRPARYVLSLSRILSLPSALIPVSPPPPRRPSSPFSTTPPTPALSVSRQVFRGGHDIVVSDGRRPHLRGFRRNFAAKNYN